MRRNWLSVLACVGALLSFQQAACAAMLHLFAAGSLAGAMTDELAASGIPGDAVAAPVFGPSGVLRERIERGEPADILASADMRQPRRLAAERGDRPVLVFARNRMCALARQSLDVTPANLLERMLDPAIRVATSTPGADPGGDYAWAVFARAEALHPGARTALEAKALKLVGGPDTQPLVAGHGQVAGVFLAGKADIMLGYCSGADEVLRDVQGLVSVPLPPALTVGPTYGMVVLSDDPLADRFAVFVMSERGQAILQRHGFVPVAGTPAPEGEAPPAPDGLAVVPVAGAPVVLTAEVLARLPTIRSEVSFNTEHGPRHATFEGPLLWTVLSRAGAVDPARPRDAVGESVSVTGSDGYAALLALGEIAPDFEGKQVILAERMDGKPLGAHHLRVVVPGDRFGGRSVRDIVRITVSAAPPARP